MGNQSSLPLNIGTLMLYIAHLHSSGLAHSTIKTSVSAINYINKIHNGRDVTENFWIQKMLIGITKQTPSQDLRIPVTEIMLGKLIDALPTSTSSEYVALLFQSMFLLAFRAFLRVGEMTVASAHVSNANLHLNDISIEPQSRTVNISFRNYKHKVGKDPFVLSLTHMSSPLDVCIILSSYIKARGYKPGPLFLYKEKPVTTSFFASVLRDVSVTAGLNHVNLKSHSFRIGAATSCLKRGYSSDQIQRMGRWKSDAFQKYIRVQSFVL